MTDKFDCIVIGAGGFGSGTLYHLARRGCRVLGIEQFGVAHDRGSSHGQTRIIRQAYFEHPDYVPLLVRAYELWRDLEQESGQPLMHLCGLMLAGPPDGEAIPGAKLAAHRHGIAIEDVAPGERLRRFPGFRIPAGFEVLYEPNAGYLQVETCVRAHVEQAAARGAVLKTGESVVAWQSDGRSVTVRTDRDEYHGGRLVIAAGAWTGTLCRLPVPLRVVRKPQFWHEVTSADYNASAGAPAYYFELPTGRVSDPDARSVRVTSPHAAFYGFPALDGRCVKVA
ncbi:MAG TPA: N-methyl-L-tryptophan oxidase, partial [Planctomycetaceae bacterium]|nr:N-methyl-L-tryptophan oxidase [Planctomycetaceae bacterium]